MTALIVIGCVIGYAVVAVLTHAGFIAWTIDGADYEGLAPSTKSTMGMAALMWPMSLAVIVLWGVIAAPYRVSVKLGNAAQKRWS